MPTILIFLTPTRGYRGLKLTLRRIVIALCFTSRRESPITTKNHPELKPKASKDKDENAGEYTKRQATAIAMEKKRQPEGPRRAAMGRTFSK